MLPELSYLYGKPESTGLLRSEMSDFKVFEVLPYQPNGEGEHLYIHIRKTGANTVFVARELAKYFNIKEGLVSYAGLKDRYAVTEQWFGVHVPGKAVFDLSDLSIEGVEVLSYKRHNKKLRTGALSGNNFELTLKNVTNIVTLEKRWQEIVSEGVPNYFGEQRFGIDGGNIERSIALFSGTKIKDKKKRGIYLSAARSYLYNQVIHSRIQLGVFNKPSKGDVMMLAGTQSVFLVDELDAKIKQRFVEKDIDITAPMWGAGELMTTDDPKALESKIANENSEIAIGLPRFGLKQERRKIRLNISNPSIEILHESNSISADTPSSVKIKFFLPAGCYATTVLRELIQYTDCTQRAVTKVK